MKPEPLRRGQFTFYASFFDAVERLPKSRRYEAVSAIIRYGLYGETPEALNGPAAGVFSLAQPVLDSARTKAARRLARMAAEEPGPVPPTGQM